MKKCMKKNFSQMFKITEELLPMSYLFNKHNNIKKVSKVFVMEPTVYTEAERVADTLLKGEAVIINFRKIGSFGCEKSD